MGKTEAVRFGVIARQAADSLLAVLLAPPCAACGEPLPQPMSGIVCDACWRATRSLAPPFYIPHITQSRAAGVYDGTLRALVHALKYERRTSLAAPLAALVAERCGEAFDGADALVPVPLHRSRERQRGFNQAALIARALPLGCADVLVRVRSTASQTDLPADERRSNVRGAFALRCDQRGSRRASLEWLAKCVPLPSVRGTPVAVPLCPVLVDDVATTGATLSECARVLREAGAKEVRAVTVARAL